MEESGKYGTLANPKNVDPIDPELIVKGFGSYTRSTLRDSIANRLQQLSKLAKDANSAQDPETANRLMRNLAAAIDPSNVLFHMIKADVEISEQMEAMRTKGGRRSMPIPKQ
jgi:5-formyltetrahydrofolate cyclo-ligase